MVPKGTNTSADPADVPNLAHEAQGAKHNVRPTENEAEKKMKSTDPASSSVAEDPAGTLFKSNTSVADKPKADTSSRPENPNLTSSERESTNVKIPEVPPPLKASRSDREVSAGQQDSCVIPPKSVRVVVENVEARPMEVAKKLDTTDRKEVVKPRQALAKTINHKLQDPRLNFRPVAAQNQSSFFEGPKKFGEIDEGHDLLSKNYFPPPYTGNSKGTNADDAKSKVASAAVGLPFLAQPVKISQKPSSKTQVPVNKSLGESNANIGRKTTLEMQGTSNKMTADKTKNATESVEEDKSVAAGNMEEKKQVVSSSSGEYDTVQDILKATRNDKKAARKFPENSKEALELDKLRGERRKRRSELRKKFYEENSITSTSSGATPGSGSSGAEKCIATETETLSDPSNSRKRPLAKPITPKKRTLPPKVTAEKKKKLKPPTPRKDRKPQPDSFYTPGTLCWVKVQTHPYWPCMIVPPEAFLFLRKSENSKKIKEGCVVVHFLKDGCLAEVKKKDIFPYEEWRHLNEYELSEDRSSDESGGRRRKAPKRDKVAMKNVAEACEAADAILRTYGNNYPKRVRIVEEVLDEGGPDLAHQANGVNDGDQRQGNEDDEEMEDKTDKGNSFQGLEDEINYLRQRNLALNKTNTALDEKNNLLNQKLDEIRSIAESE